MDLDEVRDQFLQAVNQFAKGDPEPAKAIFSHLGDVSLANPWGPPAVGWERVSEALDPRRHDSKMDASLLLIPSPSTSRPISPASWTSNTGRPRSEGETK
jgi:hypothetical protein